MFTTTVKTIECIIGKEDLKEKMTLRAGGYQDNMKSVMEQPLAVTKVYKMEVEKTDIDTGATENYDRYAIVTDKGTYITTSQSLMGDIISYFDEIADSEFTGVVIKVISRPSKNFSGEYLKAQVLDLI